MYFAGSMKQLHLYEARYLSLLETVLSSPHKLFGHVVVQQSMQPARLHSAQTPGAYIGDNYVLCYAGIAKVTL